MSLHPVSVKKIQEERGEGGTTERSFPVSVTQMGRRQVTNGTIVIVLVIKLL